MDQKHKKLVSQVLAWTDEAQSRLGWQPDTVIGRPAEPQSLEGRVEHTLLKMGAPRKALEQLCEEARQYGFRSVCVLPKDVALARKILVDSGVKIVTVVNFPLAGSTKGSIRTACADALYHGADELDMVVELTSVRDNEPGRVRDHVGIVVEAALGKPVKAILETGLFEAEQIARAAVAAEAGGASYVKTCTGFGPRGATEEDIHILRTAVGNRLGVKASGGIRDTASALKLIEAGADLIGTSSGPHIVRP